VIGYIFNALSAFKLLLCAFDVLEVIDNALCALCGSCAILCLRCLVCILIVVQLHGLQCKSVDLGLVML